MLGIAVSRVLLDELPEHPCHRCGQGGGRQEHCSTMPLFIATLSSPMEKQRRGAVEKCRCLVLCLWPWNTFGTWLQGHHCRGGTGCRGRAGLRGHPPDPVPRCYTQLAPSEEEWQEHLFSCVLVHVAAASLCWAEFTQFHQLWNVFLERKKSISKLWSVCVRTACNAEWWLLGQEKAKPFLKAVLSSLTGYESSEKLF